MEQIKTNKHVANTAPDQAPSDTQSTTPTAAEVLVRLEKGKLTREELAALLEEVRGALAAALLAQYGYNKAGNTGKTAAFLGKTLTKAQIMRTIEMLQNYRQQCLYNVSAGQVLGALTVELEGIL